MFMTDLPEVLLWLWDGMLDHYLLLHCDDHDDCLDAVDLWPYDRQAAQQSVRFARLQLADADADHGLLSPLQPSLLNANVTLLL